MVWFGPPPTTVLVGRRLDPPFAVWPNLELENPWWKKFEKKKGVKKKGWRKKGVEVQKRIKKKKKEKKEKGVPSSSSSSSSVSPLHESYSPIYLYWLYKGGAPKEWPPPHPWPLARKLMGKPMP